MNSESWQIVSEHFANLMELDNAGQREYLDQINDSKIRKEVSGLLRTSDEKTSILNYSLERLASTVLDRTQFSRGHKVKDLQIVKELGSGAFARVYLALDTNLERRVAVKVSVDEGCEGKLMAGLEHEHVVSVFQQFNYDGLRFVSMQYVDGIDLGRLLDELNKVERTLTGSDILTIIDRLAAKDSRLSIEGLEERQHLEKCTYLEACFWLLERVASALEFMHAKNIYHLDLKPSNILLNRFGRPLLSDFNVGLNENYFAGSVREFMLGGTYEYMAPEHKEAFEKGDFTNIDQRCDLFSLGRITKELTSLAEIPANCEHALNTFTEGLLAENLNHRIDDAKICVETFKNLGKLCRIDRSLPRVSKLGSFIRSYPYKTSTFAILIPQFLASLFNISYNQQIIVDNLTQVQQQLFPTLVLIYNLIFYPIGIGILLSGFLNLRRQQERKNQATRKILLKMPRKLFFASSIGWLPGAILFPLALDLFRPPVGAETYIHFAISFAFSWLIATTYSLLLTWDFCIRNFYPLCWSYYEDVTEQSRKELEPVLRNVKFLHLAGGLIPLIGACLVTYYAAHATLFQTVLVFLIGLGMLGFILTTRIEQQLRDFIARFVN